MSWGHWKIIVRVCGTELKCAQEGSTRGQEEGSKCVQVCVWTVQHSLPPALPTAPVPFLLWRPRAFTPSLRTRHPGTLHPCLLSSLPHPLPEGTPLIYPAEQLSEGRDLVSFTALSMVGE